MAELTCMIVENETDAQEHLQALIARNPIRAIRVVKIAANGDDAYLYLRDHKVDLVFLDMNMPVMNGRALLNVLEDKAEKPTIIIVSVENHRDIAWDHRGFIKYHLDKPINQEGFDKALNEVLKNFPETFITLDFFTKDKKKVLMSMDLNHLFCIECAGNQKSFFYSAASPMPTHPNLEVYTHFQNKLETIYTMLPLKQFYMINQSVIINGTYISHYEPTRERLYLKTGESYSVSRGRKKDFVQWYQQLSKAR